MPDSLVQNGVQPIGLQNVAGEKRGCLALLRLSHFLGFGEYEPHPLFCFFQHRVRTLLATQLAAAESPRGHLSLNKNWKFRLGDEWAWAEDGFGSGWATKNSTY